MWSSINIQAVHSSWPQRTFAVPRCSDSREKKTRNRRSKEERKTMVESFIKKYQSSNGGKFPSLNLTHKEVGGSFYIVREIVREIIQENRVLGPGSLTSKSLRLEYFPEEEEATEESFSMDMSPLSIATINHTIELQEEQSISNENSRISEITELNESHLVDTFVPQVNCGDHFDDKFSNGNLNGKQENLGLEESNADKQIEVGKVEVHGQKSGKVQLSTSGETGIDKIEHLSSQDASVSSPSLSEVVNSDDSIERGNKVVTPFNYLGGRTYYSRSTSVPESRISLDASPAKEYSSQSSVATEDPDESQKKSEFATSIEARTPIKAQISSSKDPGICKVEESTPRCQAVPKTPVDEFVVRDDNCTTKNNEVTSGFNSPEGSNANLGSDVSFSVSDNSVNPVPSNASDQMQSYLYFKDYLSLPSAVIKTHNRDESREKENKPTSFEVRKSFDDDGFRDKSPAFGTDSTAIGLEMPVNEISAESDSEPVSQNLESPACVSSVQPSLQSNDLESVTSDTKCTSGESLQPDDNVRIFSEVKVENESDVNKTDSAKNSVSISKNEVNKKSDTSEINPFLAAVKSFLEAVMKFWTE